LSHENLGKSKIVADACEGRGICGKTQRGEWTPVAPVSSCQLFGHVERFRSASTVSCRQNCPATSQAGYEFFPYSQDASRMSLQARNNTFTFDHCLLYLFTLHW
jgi:hypothetical protein